MHFPDPPSPLRKALLAPAVLAYAAASRMHRAILSRTRARARPRDFKNTTPLVVIGSLRAGGAGKTPVARETARHLRSMGLRVGVLAYAIHRRDSGACTEIFPGSDWRESSDEAVLLARGLSETRKDGAGNGVRVFVTRDRARAWEALARTGEFDVLVSDDGLMDPRLRGAFRVVLTGGEERAGRPRWTDLLPAGPYRLTAAALKDVDWVLREGAGFTRETVPPAGWNPARPCWILCGLGNPRAFERSLRDAGIAIRGISIGPDHGLPGMPCALRDARQGGTDTFLCSEKDFIKLEQNPFRPAKLFPVGERVTLSPEFLDALGAFPGFPGGSSS